MYSKDKIIIRVNELTKEYLETNDEKILPIIKYELYKIVKSYIKKIGLEYNEYAYSTGIIIINNVVNNYFKNYNNMHGIGLTEKLISTLKKMPLRKNVYQLEDSKEEDLLIQRYSYIVDKKLKEIGSLNNFALRKLMFQKYIDIVRRLQSQNDLNKITKMADSQLFQYGLSKRREKNKIYKDYLEKGKPILIRFLVLFDKDEKQNIIEYYKDIVKKYFSTVESYNGNEFEKYVFNELSKINLSRIDDFMDIYKESRHLKYKTERRR